MAHASDLIEKDILGYLKQHENKEILRFITCGSVDDGKSTLIGRLLHDSKMIFEDQLAAIEQDSKKVGTQGEEVDLALLVDGLQSEREQGITIDVAYRYFSTDKRKFIIADTPGHEQYTRNMATGGSTCDLAVILVDAAHGVQTQTKRHSFICALFGIKHLVVAINKMDLVDYSQEVFEKIKADYREMAAAIDVPDIHFVPISALKGDNVVNKSEALSWYKGKTLMDYLETVTVSTHASDNFRLPVQLVCRSSSDFRGFQGTIASGQISVGDDISVVPSNTKSTVKSIVTFDGELESASAGKAVTITLNDEVDVSRGDMLAKSTSLPNVASRLRAKMLWMHDDAMQLGKEYLIKFASKSVFARVDTLHYRIDVNSFDETAADTLELNEIGKVDINLSEPVAFDSYQDNRQTGSFIIIDRMTNLTVGAGMIQKGLLKSSKTAYAASADELGNLSAFEKELILLVRKHFSKI